MKKEYINPEIEVLGLNCLNEMLAFSDNQREPEDHNDDIY